ncbi:helix-turn-helix transcriptional regulator [Saccharopolyspora sp. NPDC050389]|uniref:helix-turn-helix domain-containing protein n=1 Tax=Saccharopolyspora sp. NPDC050389 TaxID=3155516 RepID=UPI0033C0A2BA
MLRELRETAGKKRSEAADTLECQVAKISKIETGRATLSPGDARLLVDLYGADDEVADAVFQLARDARKRTQVRFPDWVKRFVTMESIAESIDVYEPELIPGLMQTAEYAMAVTAATHPEKTGEEIEQMANTRASRQARLADEDPIKYSAVISEAVIRRPIGGPAVMRPQLEHLCRLSELPNVTLRIIPFAAGAHSAMGSSFRVIRLRKPSGARTVYLEDAVFGHYLDGSTQIDRHARAFELLQSVASSEADTVATLQRVIRELT